MSLTFDRMESRGWYATTITEKALEFAQGDDSRIVAPAFARFLASLNVAFEWSADDHRKIKVGGYWDVVIAATTETTETLFGTSDGKTWLLYGNTVIPGVVVLMGLSYRVGPFPSHSLLSINEFLKGVQRA